MAEEFAPIETQEAFDAAVAERLEAVRQEERDKYADYDDIKNQLSAANETNATQAAEITRLQTDNLKQRIAAETGLPSAMANRLVGDDEKAIREDAAELLKTIKPQRKAPPMRNPDADGKPSKDDAYKRMLDGLKNN